MNTLQLRMILILLTIGLGTNTAWSGQNPSATSATDSHAKVSSGATATPGKHAGASKGALPSIVNEEEIPAFLLTDPCDTGDS